MPSPSAPLSSFWLAKSVGDNLLVTPRSWSREPSPCLRISPRCCPCADRLAERVLSAAHHLLRAIASATGYDERTVRRSLTPAANAAPDPVVVDRETGEVYDGPRIRGAFRDSGLSPLVATVAGMRTAPTGRTPHEVVEVYDVGECCGQPLDGRGVHRGYLRCHSCPGESHRTFTCPECGTVHCDPPHTGPREVVGSDYFGGPLDGPTADRGDG